jgi:membrane fusion protein, multidrug efflux system
MTSSTNAAMRWVHWIVGAVVALAFAVGVVFLMLWLAGKFSPKVPSTSAEPETAAASIPSDRLATAHLITLPVVESAVGTVKAVHEVSIGSKLLARVVEINLRASQKVRADDVLVQLDNSDLRAKLEQAKAAVASAEAAETQAVSDEHRAASLVKTRTISQQQYEQSVTALRGAEANLKRAREAVKESEVMLGWATIRSPIDGTVIDKKVDVGDMVSPGQLLLTLYDPKRMQLVASVRESLASRLEPDQRIAVCLDKFAGKQCAGTISEIVPEAQSESRTFQVKVTGPCPPGVYAGMFGRMLIPLDDEQVLVIPKAAVRLVGGLEQVNVFKNGQTARRVIRTRRTIGDNVEVLSGLHEGEQVVLPDAGD